MKSNEPREQRKSRKNKEKAELLTLGQVLFWVAPRLKHETFDSFGFSAGRGKLSFCICDMVDLLIKNDKTPRKNYWVHWLLLQYACVSRVEWASLGLLTSSAMCLCFTCGMSMSGFTDLICNVSVFHVWNEHVWIHWPHSQCGRV